MKRIIVLITVVVILLTTAACQANPDEIIVVPKDEERLIEQAAKEEGGTKVEEINIEKTHFNYESSNKKGNITIHVDAECYIPDVDTLSIYEVRMQPFTQEMVTDVYEYVFGTERVMDRSERTMLKYEIQTVILELTRKLAENDYENEEEKAQIEQDLATMQEAYALAPEHSINVERKECDGKLKIAKDDDGGEMYEYYELSGYSIDSDKNMSVQTYTEEQLKEGKLSFFSHNNLNYSSSEVWYRKFEGSKDDAELSEKVGISYEKACEMCDEFLRGCGLEDVFTPSDAYIMSDGGVGLVDVDENNKDDAPGENFAYKIIYTRKIDGVNSFNGTNGTYLDTTEYTVPWEYELMSFFVDKNGIISFDWADPVIVGEVVQKNCTLKPFDEIKNIFEEMMDIVYTARLDYYMLEDAEMLIDVQRIELCMMRIRKQNAGVEEGLFIPAWVFYGYNEYETPGGEKLFNLEGNGGASSTKKDPIALLAINAVDGSIIDIAKGY